MKTQSTESKAQKQKKPQRTLKFRKELEFK